MNKSTDFSETLELHCKDHPSLKPDFFCLGSNCKFVLLCHECTLQNLDHAKEHVNFIKPCESLWTLIRKNFLKKDPLKEKVFNNQYVQLKQQLENLLDRNLQLLEKKVAIMLHDLRQNLNWKIQEFFNNIGIREERQFFQKPKDFLNYLHEKSNNIKEQKDLINSILQKNTNGNQEENYKSQVLSYLSEKSAKITENISTFSKPEVFMAGLQKDLLDFRSFFEFSEFSFNETSANNACIPLTITDRFEQDSLNEHPVDLTNYDTIPTFAQRYHKPNSLDNNTLDVFGKVTLIQTIDCGHSKQEKINEGVIISQVSWIDFENSAKLITCSKDKTLRVFDFASFKLEKVLIGHTDWVYRFLHFKEMKLLISGGIDKSLRLWDLKTRDWKCTKAINCESSIISLVKLDEESLVFSMRLHGLKIMDLQMNILSHYKFNQDKEIWTICPRKKSGNLYLFLGLVDGSIAILHYQKNLGNLSLLNSFKECHNSLIFDIIPYENLEKEYIISCSGDGMIKLWEVTAGVVDWKLTLEKSLKAHEGFIRKILIYKDDILVSCSDDANLKFWKLPEVKLVQIIKKAHGLAIYWLEKFSDEIILTAGEDNLSLVKFWQ